MIAWGAFLGLGEMQGQNAVEMVNLVLHQRRPEGLAIKPALIAVDAVADNPNRNWSAHRDHDREEAQAALVEELLLM